MIPLLTTVVDIVRLSIIRDGKAKEFLDKYSTHIYRIWREIPRNKGRAVEESLWYFRPAPYRRLSHSAKAMFELLKPGSTPALDSAADQDSPDSLMRDYAPTLSF